MRWMLASLAVSTVLAAFAVSAMLASPAFAGSRGVSPDATRSSQPTHELAVASGAHQGHIVGVAKRRHHHRSHRSARPTGRVIRALNASGVSGPAPSLPRTPRSTPQPAGNRVPIADHHRHETRVSRSGGSGGKARLQHTSLALAGADQPDARDHSEATPRVKGCLTRRGGMIRGRAPPRCEDNDPSARVRFRAAATSFAATRSVALRASEPPHPIFLSQFTTHASVAAFSGSGVRAPRDSMAPDRRACVFRGDPGHPYAARPEGTAAYDPSPSFGGIPCPASA